MGGQHRMRVRACGSRRHEAAGRCRLGERGHRSQPPALHRTGRLPGDPAARCHHGGDLQGLRHQSGPRTPRPGHSPKVARTRPSFRRKLPTGCDPGDRWRRAHSRPYQLSGLLYDADLFRRLRVRGQARGHKGIDDSMRALSLVSGRPYDDIREQGGIWLSDHRDDQHLLVAVVDTAHLAATMAMQTRDFSIARRAAGIAMGAAPDVEVPKLDFAAATAAQGRPTRAPPWFERSCCSTTPTGRLTWTTAPPICFVRRAGHHHACGLDEAATRSHVIRWRERRALGPFCLARERPQVDPWGHHPPANFLFCARSVSACRYAPDREGLSR